MTIDKKNLKVQESYDELKDFLKAIQKRDDYDPTIHLIPDFPNRKLGIYYHTGESGSGEVIEMILEDVSFTASYDHKEHREIKKWFLTYDEAFNFLNFLNSLKWERTDTHLNLNYRSETGMGMMEGEKFGEEQLEFNYKTESGNSQKMFINSIYKNEIHMMATIK